MRRATALCRSGSASISSQRGRSVADLAECEQPLTGRQHLAAGLAQAPERAPSPR
jgi:hypothetical protein